VTSGLLLSSSVADGAARVRHADGLPEEARGRGGRPDGRIEVPGSWFWIGWWSSAPRRSTGPRHLPHHLVDGRSRVLLTFFLVVVAGRATGETDITPTGPISKITQLTFGAIKPAT